jgi:hypothetical protein
VVNSCSTGNNHNDTDCYIHFNLDDLLANFTGSDLATEIDKCLNPEGRRYRDNICGDVYRKKAAKSHVEGHSGDGNPRDLKHLVNSFELPR